MSNLSELYGKLTVGERKFISRSLSNESKTQLLTLFKQLVKGAGTNHYTFEIQGKGPKEIAVLKNQLYNFVLERLVIYNRKESVDLQCRIALSEVEILKNKFLYKQALKKISKLKKLLQDHERYIYLQELLLTETEIKYFIETERQFHLTTARLLSAFDHLSIQNQDFVREKLGFFEVRSSIHKEQLHSKPSSKTVESLPNKNNRSAHYYGLLRLLIIKLQAGEYDNAVELANELHEQIEENFHEFIHLPFQVLDVSFLSALAFLLSKNEQLQTVRDRMMRISRDYPNLQMKYVERIMYIDWSEAVVHRHPLSTIQKMLKSFEKVEDEIEIDFKNRIIEQIANWFLRSQDYRSANQWNRKLFDQPRKTTQAHALRAELRLTYIHYKMDRLDHMDKSIQRLLSRPSNGLTEKLLETLTNVKEHPGKNAESLISFLNYWK